MEFPSAEMADRRRLSLNVMLNCRTLLSEADGEKDSFNCFEYGRQDFNRTTSRIACRRGTSSYRTASEAREEDMCLRTLCYKAFLDGVTLAQLKRLLAGQNFPSILVPELLSWAIHLDKSPRLLLPILKLWPNERLILSDIFPLAFEGRTSPSPQHRSRFLLNGFNTIAFGAVSRAYAWRYDCATSAIISAIAKLQEESIPVSKEYKIQVFDLRGVPLSDSDFSTLAKLTLAPLLTSNLQSKRNIYLNFIDEKHWAPNIKGKL